MLDKIIVIIGIIFTVLLLIILYSSFIFSGKINEVENQGEELGTKKAVSK
jgi:uncharacterized protein YpmB